MNPTEYENACQELKGLESWLTRLHDQHPGPGKGFTKAGVRRMIARLQEELAQYESSQEVERCGPRETT
jgi:hypothetical protein